MARLNPSEESIADADYQKKFNRDLSKDSKKNAEDLKSKESSPDAEWKNATKKQGENNPKKGVFRFAGRRAGKLRSGSAFIFVVAIILGGVWYSSVFAPNILLVNVKEMYTNDLADATIALDTYYKKLMNYKIGRSNCGEQLSIKCKLSTMSRGQKEAFEKRGFTVMGSKVMEDGRDDFQPGDEVPQESRYEVSAIIPPLYSPGLIASGDMLFLYAGLSDANKALVYGVFNPKSGFFMDTRFKQRLSSKYGITKQQTVYGQDEQQVDQSFDRAVRYGDGYGGGVGTYGDPSQQGGVSLGALSNPIVAAQMQLAAFNTTQITNSYTQLECSWYSFARQVTNNAETAKKTTIARFAMQYLKAADAIKGGLSDTVATNVLSSKLASSTFGGYDGPSATDSTIYKMIVYGDPPIPSIYGLLFSLNTFELIAGLAPSWAIIMASAGGLGGVTNAPGTIAMPPANLTGSDREYCLSGETEAQKSALKPSDSASTRCTEAIGAMAPAGTQALVTDAIDVASRTCPEPHRDEPHRTFEGTDSISTSARLVDEQLTPFVSGLFSANVIAWANAESLLFTSQTKGIAASDTLFAGTGEILGDMAMSRGMMPSNAIYMAEYLAKKDDVMKNYREVARYNARKDPFDIYNQFSFLGAIVHNITPVYNEESPLFSTVANIFSFVGDGIKHLNPNANAIYYLQPDPFNPLRLQCPDPQYLSIMIMADMGCNVRYSFSRSELAADVDSVLDYMTQTHTDAYQPKIDDLNERLATADPEGDQENIQRQINLVEGVSGQPYIDRMTGEAIPNSEYDKFLQYCVNRRDPWGRSAMHIQYEEQTDEVKEYRAADKEGGVEAISTSDRGDPYEQTATAGYPSITEGAKDDQDWYTGKKCTEQSEMLKNFRAYTMICSVDGSLSGAVDCTEPDSEGNIRYNDAFYMNNDILFAGWF